MDRLTIDEAIAKYRENARYFKRTTNVAYALELEQIAEWLEELKEYRKHIKLTEIPKQYKLGFQDGIVNGFENGYNNALDDLIQKCDRAKFLESEIALSDIHQGTNSGLSMAIHFAEQLKEGEENE